MAEITKQIEDSSIPYPQRHLLAAELRRDLDHIQSDSETIFSETDLIELVDLHSTWLHRTLTLFGGWKKAIEMIIAFIPLIAAATLVSKEGKMIDFIREGGAGMYVILIIGVFLLINEFQNVFRLILVKDHSKQNLRLDTSSVLLGCLAMITFGVGWTVLGIYISATASIHANTSYEILMIGVKESLTPTILSSLLAAIVVLAHYTTRRVLHIWHAPIVD